MKGFTLIEFIIYIAILAVVLLVSFNFSWQIIFSNEKAQSQREVQQNARFVMEKISRILRQAKSVNTPSPGSSANILSLEMKDPLLDPTVFEITDNKLYITQGADPSYELTNNRVEVSNIQFRNLSFADTPETIQIDISLKHVNPSGRTEYDVSFDFKLSEGLAFGEGSAPPPSECWGTEGICDPACQYADPGTTTDYFTDPGCLDFCPSSSPLYLNPIGTCSEDGTGNCYKMTDSSTEYTSCFQGTECGVGCWAQDSACDPACQYADPGTTTDYFTDPGCLDFCPSSSPLYLNPIGTCSEDGTGNCYKMTDSSTEYTSCFQGDSCEGICSGTCTECRGLNQTQCNQQQGCSWFFRWCLGTCTSCDTISTQSSCENQLGCSWQETDWYWDLADRETGFLSYASCSWQEASVWNWNLTDSQTGYLSYLNCEWYEGEICKGTVTSCDSFTDQASCENQSGCSWTGGCSGACTSCENLGWLDCRSQDGCSWSFGQGCTGTCTSCDTISTQSSCENQLGCSWSPQYCFGEASTCDSYSTQEECLSQDGCQWGTP